jgi:hypothetical protein
MFTKAHIGKYTHFFNVVTSKPFMKFAYAALLLTTLTHATHETTTVRHNPMIHNFTEDGKNLTVH